MKTGAVPPIGMPLPIRNLRIKLSHGQVFWREVGHGTAIVFLNGSWGDGSDWLPVLETLGSTYQCLALDLLGFGESDRPRLSYSIALEVNTLLEFVNALKLKTFFLVAPEVGGWVAASFAQQHPQRVAGLVLINAEGVVLADHRGRWFWPRLLTNPLVGWLLRSLSPLVRVLGNADNIAALLRLRQRLRRSPVACKLLFGRRAAAINAELLNEQIPWLKIPVLVLQPEHDTSVSTALNRLYATAPHAMARSVSQPYPAVLSNLPDDVAGEIRRFVRITVSNLN